MKSCPSHCETSATRQSLRKLRRERIRQGRAPAGFASKPLQEYSFKNLETLLLEPLKTTKTCLSHCETSATRQRVRKLRRERIRKGRAPAGFASKPLQECSLNENVLQPLRGSATRQSVRKLRRERIRKGRSPAGFASKPLQECSLKNLETLLLEPLKTMKSCPIKTMKACLSHCETSATRQSLRKLRRERIRKGKAPAGFASKPLQECSLKNLETLRLEPLKTMKSCPSHCETSATRSLRKLRRERIRKGRAPAGFASKPLRNCNLKNLETLLLEPLKTNEIVPQPLRNFSHQAKPKKAASGAHPKRQSPSRFCVQAIAELQPQKSRNVVFGTPKNNEIVPQPLRNCSHRQSPRRLRRERVRKTMRLEPLKTMKSCPSHCETSATRQSLRKLRRERIRKGRAPAGFASKPLRNCNLKNLETLFLEPLKTMKSCPSHCETAATRQSPRKLRRERIRNKGRASAGFASKPLKECSTARKHSSRRAPP